MECIPAFRLLVVNVALPDPSRVAMPRVVVPSRKITIPVGVPFAEVTAQVKVTGLPKIDGLVEEAIAAAVGAGCTVWVSTGEVLPAKLLLPL